MNNYQILETVNHTPKAGDLYFLQLKDHPVGSEPWGPYCCLLLRRFEDGDMWEVALTEKLSAFSNSCYRKPNKNWKVIQTGTEKRVVLFSHDSCVSSKRFQYYLGTISDKELRGVYDSLINLRLSMIKDSRKKQAKVIPEDKHTPKAGDLYWMQMKDNPKGHEEQKPRPCLLLHHFGNQDMWEVVVAKRITADTNSRFLHPDKNWKRLFSSREKRVALFNQRDCISKERFGKYEGRISNSDLRSIHYGLKELYEVMLEEITEKEAEMSA